MSDLQIITPAQRDAGLIGKFTGDWDTVYVVNVTPYPRYFWNGTALEAALTIGSDGTVKGGGGPVSVGGATIAVAASRALIASDNGLSLDCTAAAITLTVPAVGVVGTDGKPFPANFGCSVQPNGTTSVASAGTPLLNGATTTVTRAATSQGIFAIVPKSTANSYVVSGV